MSSGKKKKVKAKKVTSQYAGIQRSGFDTDFGSAESFKEGDKLRTTASLSEPFRPIPGIAAQGIQNNLNFLQESPEQQIRDATSGRNPLYNLLAESTQRALDKELGRLRINNQLTGNQNSTLAGTATARLLNGSVMRRNNDLLQALGYGNEQGRANLNAALGTTTALNSLISPLAAGSSANLNTALTNQDQVALANARNQLQADLYNTQVANSSGTNLGNVIGAGVGLLGSLAAPLLGGFRLPNSRSGGGSGPPVSNTPFVPTGDGSIIRNTLGFSPLSMSGFEMVGV